MKKQDIRQVVVWVVFLAALVPLTGQRAIMRFGGKEGWQLTDTRINIEERQGRYGYSALAVEKPGIGFDAHTDLYLGFNTTPAMEQTGNYNAVLSSALVAGEPSAYLGSGAALCTGYADREGVRISPQQDSALFSGGVLSSFSIGFWIYPERTESGSVLLEWNASRPRGTEIVLQEISARFIKNKFEWTLLNVWDSAEKNEFDVRLRSRANVVPHVWTHHLLTYNSESGLLEYRVNGKTERIVYITTTGREDGVVLQGILGRRSDLLVGKHYAGLLDELRVQKEYAGDPDLIKTAGFFEQHPRQGGYVSTMIMDTGGTGSTAHRLIPSIDRPPQTDAQFFIRAGNNRYEWTDTFPEWVPVCPNVPIKNVQGQFFQLAVRLYPDGSGTHSPRLNELVLEYTQDRAPFPPVRVTAEGADASVLLDWSPSIDADVVGYRIYFGEKNELYFSEGSPIDVGNFTSYTVRNLKNGTLYFFAIAARDKFGNVSTVLSKEVWARPLQSCKK